MKYLKLATAIVLALVVMNVAAMSVLADAPAGTGSVSASLVDNQKHSIPAKSSQWYRFDYWVKDDGKRPVTYLTLVDANNSGVGFEVWTAEQLANLASSYADAQADPMHNQPIGRGTAATINCDSGVLDGSGACRSSDLTWRGAFGISGTYYVRVTNDTTTPMSFTLIVR